jgi:isoleucyl-tRNA synthetase
MLKEADAAYEAYDYARVVNCLLRFCSADLSNFYLDASKDRLYVWPRKHQWLCFAARPPN